MDEPKHSSQHLKAILQALLVTFLWSTSWVLIKLGLQANLPPISFAGLRYTLAFLCLLPFVLFNSSQREKIRQIPGNIWVQLILLGLLIYSITQSAQYIGLAYLPSATLSLILNLSPLLVALISGRTRVEAAHKGQWIGIVLTSAGTLIFFLPFMFSSGQWIGLLAAIVGLAANSIASIFGRKVNLHSGLSPIIVTTISMGIGGIVMLVVGGLTQGMGNLNLTQWLIVIWLAVVNTALGFTLWNNTLRTLTAVESSILNSTMMPQIAVLAWIFLGEGLDGKQITGILLVLVGTFIVQMRPRKKAE